MAKTDVRDNKYEVNHWRLRKEMPNQLESNQGYRRQQRDQGDKGKIPVDEVQHLKDGCAMRDA